MSRHLRPNIRSLIPRLELQPGDLVIDDYFTLFEAVGALEVCFMFIAVIM